MLGPYYRGHDNDTKQGKVGAGVAVWSVALRQFQASRCPTCRRGMPVLGAAQRCHPEVHFVLANQGERAGSVGSYLSGQAFQLKKVLLDSGHQFSRSPGPGALPATLFFGASGKLVEQGMGELSAATPAQKLQSLEMVRQADIAPGRAR